MDFSFYHLHTLDLTNASVSPDNLASVLSRCNCLNNLSLEGLRLNSHVVRSMLVCNDLIRLNLSLCKSVDTRDVAYLIKQNKNLQELNISWTSMCEEDPSQMIEHFPSSLARLNMSGYRTTLFDHHVLRICEKCPQLVELDISDSNTVTSVCVQHLDDKLKDTLQAVNLSRCYSILPKQYLKFGSFKMIRHVDVFGIMDDNSVILLESALPRINVCMRPFTTIARPDSP